MVKRSWSALLVSVLLWICLCPPVFIEADSIQITKSANFGQFPTNISFNLSASSDYEITGARLHYRVHRQSYAIVVSEALVRFTPSKNVDLGYTIDLRRAGGLPPGTLIDYWWTITDANGSVTQSQVTTIRFDDNRYSWKALSQGLVTLNWYSGSDSFAKTLMDTAQQALIKLHEDTGAALVQPVSIYIYENAQALQGSMVFPQEWTGGVAFTDFNTICIGIEPANVSWGKRAIVHELAHLVTSQMTDNPYGGIPTWLNEGLSMYAEGPLDAVYVAFMNAALDQQTLFSVASLASPFSAFANLSYLSYAQSYHIVKYLIEQYGQDKMLQLLNTFASGATTDDALLAVYGFDTEGLNKDWQTFIVNTVPERVNSDIIWTPWLVVLMVMVAGATSIIGVWLFYPASFTDRKKS
ncbi:peptidase MA domain-containing protein [Dehalogenimonas alkenigignens]|uniref:Peptidase MA superfamily n=1 Tax=Dehalogenimonas alkenigignens TaxID=1217799 RepID=A0A0W0GJ84_9CHLR|nr:Peptidase MA superfamily [Dehalogenimonas alkenigignens]PVV84935.1 peptidase MA domain-containing protein [Dehalogenimonas alkenigignens]